MKFLFFALIGLVIWAILKKSQTSSQGLPRADTNRAGSTSGSTTPRRALSPAQQECHARLQAALTSMIILTQPRLDQLLNNAPLAMSARVVDFAVCAKDSLPIAVVTLDSDDNSMEQVITSAGLRYVNFRSSRLPDEQTIRESLGFL